ncbi:hypothetical protein [Sphaerisporangium fuscum]|nr:hypothetical protein [Sphaerisporangium fuscum]
MRSRITHLLMAALVCTGLTAAIAQGVPDRDQHTTATLAFGDPRGNCC